MCVLIFVFHGFCHQKPAVLQPAGSLHRLDPPESPPVSSQVRRGGRSGGALRAARAGSRALEGMRLDGVVEFEPGFRARDRLTVTTWSHKGVVFSP